MDATTLTILLITVVLGLTHDTIVIRYNRRYTRKCRDSYNRVITALEGNPSLGWDNEPKKEGDRDREKIRSLDSSPPEP